VRRDAKESQHGGGNPPGHETDNLLVIRLKELLKKKKILYHLMTG
jgi:hypothetical protein